MSPSGERVTSVIRRFVQQSPLLPMYAGKVDCIFIDPPYNTGNEGWAYNDNVNAPMIKEWLAANPIGIEDGLRHDKWCAMMWPRLRLLHELLADHGSIWVTLDDVEAHRAKLILNEIFGEEALVANICWKKKTNGNNMGHIPPVHDHLLVFAKNTGDLITYGIDFDDDYIAKSYSNSDSDARGPWTTDDLSANHEGPYFEIVDTATGNKFFPPEGRYWVFNEVEVNRRLAEGRIIFGKTGGKRPVQKKFLNERANLSRKAETWWDSHGLNSEGTEVLKGMFGGKPFDHSKPTSLIQSALEIATDKDSLILDSFAGSGTTAHAVLEANKRDNGNRKFILVEMEDYANDLTAERVRRVINGYDFTGTQRTELMRETLNWSKLQKADRLTEQVEKIENLHGHEYDKITKQVKDGALIVTGEKAVAERTDGLGGTFTYCTLGAPLELDAILQGDDLPAWDALGQVLFHMATNAPLDPAQLDAATGYLGQADGQHLWLIYRPDLAWLKSPDAALTLTFARNVAAAKPGRHLVFAPARHVSQKMLDAEAVPVEFVPLPFALYRIERG